MRLSLTRLVTFHARHHYWVAEWSAEENRRRFGKTSDPEGHGHLYQCWVTVTGEPDATTGMIVDLAVLDLVIAEIVGGLNGVNLNESLYLFRSGTRQPSCEGLAQHLFEEISDRLPQGVRLARVRVAEDPTLFADYTDTLTALE